MYGTRFYSILKIIRTSIIICCVSQIFQCSGEQNEIAVKNNNSTKADNIIEVEDSTNADYLAKLDKRINNWFQRLDEDSAFLESFPPKQGLVPDKETAAKIAEAVWLPLYGEEVYNQRPYRVILVNDSIWIVHGHYWTWEDGSPARMGGTVHAKIRKSDGCVLLVVQSK